jgi:S-adenosylmethionine:tRNA ribosyltransferase-isomerase
MSTLTDIPRVPDELDFELPAGLEAGEPPEARGLARDDVRLMISYRSDDRIVHTRFRDLPAFLRRGDVLVVNTSGTLNASLPARRADGSVLELHLSTHLPGDIWTVELRQPTDGGTVPLLSLTPPEVLRLPAGGTATLHDRYHCGCFAPGDPAETRLWTATLELPAPLVEYLIHHGSPIRYGYVRDEWPNEYYQTVFAAEAGSAEMPSAGRAFTPQTLRQLGERGVQIAPLLLHTGVASLEEHEPPYEEYFRVPADTARTVNEAHAAGRRVIAVGTTVVRALETVTDEDGTVREGEGWTCTLITPERGVHAVDGLLTGLHEPRATHLLMLEAIAGRAHLRGAYREALDHGYLWHEFGDLHLIL